MTRDGKTWTDITSRSRACRPMRMCRASPRRRTMSTSSMRRSITIAPMITARSSTRALTAATTSDRSARAFRRATPSRRWPKIRKPERVLRSEFGLFVSPDRGGRWMRKVESADRADSRDRDPPTRQRHDRRDARPQHLDSRRHVAVAAIRGRAEDRCVPVRHARRHAVQPRQRSRLRDRQAVLRQNPTYGAAISYYLSKPQTNVALRIRDASGTQVREITGNDLRDAWPASTDLLGPAASGHCRQPPHSRPAVVVAVAAGFGGGGNNGPNVLPGDYRVTLVVDGKDVAPRRCM